MRLRARATVACKHEMVLPMSMVLRLRFMLGCGIATFAFDQEIVVEGCHGIVKGDGRVSRGTCVSVIKNVEGYACW
jgi:hypothetical protein